MTNQPWECIRCHKINAPWLPHCYCLPKEKTETEKIREIVGEKWVMMFTDIKGEVLQAVISSHERLPEAVKSVLAADGRNIYFEDKTPWRVENEALNGLTSHKCRVSNKE